MTTMLKLKWYSDYSNVEPWPVGLRQNVSDHGKHPSVWHVTKRQLLLQKPDHLKSLIVWDC